MVQGLVLLALLAPGLQAAGAEASTPLAGPCDVAALPLDVRLGPGWTPEQEERIGALLCGMLPILQDLYGAPFERLPVTLVKDPEAAGGWTFSPAALEVRSDGAWDPQLLTHELVHAFRGRRVLTQAEDGRVLPELFGFEEGFAEAVADLALNEYVRRHCPGGECPGGLVPSRRFWTSSLEWRYDFANDASLRSGMLWSDGGGTGKARERYQMAAAAILRLEAALPGFSRRFNQEYYARLRGEPPYQPGREGVLRVLESVAPRIDGLPARDWVALQHVLGGPAPPGARDWLVDGSPGAGLGATSHRFLHFVETLPGGWDAGLGRATGILSLSPASGGGEASRLFPVVMQPPASGGFPLEELVLFRRPAECRGLRVAQPLCIPQPEALGLYQLQTRWLAPPSGADATGVVVTAYPLLLGRPPADYDPARHAFAGGVIGAGSGQLVITHSERPGEVRAAVRNGAFYAEVPSCRRPGDDCWVEPYADWSEDLVSVPGTLTFQFTGEDGRSFEERRSIVFGGRAGRHLFLLGVR